MGMEGRRRAVGIVRVSRVKGREGESFASPGEQQDRIRQACERDSLELVDVFEELDVSGGTPLAKRAGLREAVERVEAGEADVVVAAYFDRLVRSLTVQDELVSRVERAGGRVLAVDVGEVSAGSAGQWLSGTMLGAFSEYVRRTAKERSGEAQARAVRRGVAPWPNVPPGYRRGADGILEVDEAVAPAVREAFALRAAGGTWQDVRDVLRARGVDRSYHGVQAMLHSRVYLGEVHFGDLVNLEAHPAIVDRETWRAVQRVRSPRGPRPASERLLARLGVLRCGTCNARMVVGVQTQHGRRYPFYRCPPNGDCPRHMTIGAEIAEAAVVDAVRVALADVEGRASVEDGARRAEAVLESAQADLDAAIRAFAGLEGERAAVERLAELRAARDAAAEQVEHLGGHRRVVSVSVADWERLSLGARRELVRAVVARALVVPGRGAGRVRVELVGGE
jgi:DNA invertase Pin-like site-specific DNA recombinase